MGLNVTIYLETELRNEFYSKHPVTIKNKCSSSIGNFVLSGCGSKPTLEVVGDFRRSSSSTPAPPPPPNQTHTHISHRCSQDNTLHIFDSDIYEPFLKHEKSHQTLVERH
jgi:hypothetical protein